MIIMSFKIIPLDLMCFTSLKYQKKTGLNEFSTLVGKNWLLFAFEAVYVPRFNLYFVVLAEGTIFYVGGFLLLSPRWSRGFRDFEIFFVEFPVHKVFLKTNEVASAQETCLVILLKKLKCLQEYF